ncbi:hypothetical protein EJB05_01500, partial [Eragrostis curvula]
MAGGSSRKRNGGRKRRRRRKRPNPMDQLTDDLLVEILSRVPYRSVRRFTCVSKRWRDLIAHPDHRRKLPQTLAGFFYHFYDSSPSCFVNVSGTGPPLVDASLAFLPDRERKGLNLSDSCNGLLLCHRFRIATDLDEFDYLVINPATGNWVTVPVPRRRSDTVRARLGFDPAISSHFHVFEFQLDWDWDSDGEDGHIDGDGHVLGVKIYSSETGLWSYKQSDWSDDVTLATYCKSVFVNGMLYVVATEFVIGVVDVEGKTWRIIDFPFEKPSVDAAPGYIDLLQGKLHLAIGKGDVTGDKLEIWVLEDVSSEEWTLKHTVSLMHMVGLQFVLFGYDYIVAAVHPDRNMVFFIFGDDKALMSYDMDSGKVCVIRKLGRNCSQYFGIPYVPLLSESMADGQQ